MKLRLLKHKLKICLTTLAPFVGGAEVAAERLARGLQETGHEVFLVVGKQGEVMEHMQQAGLRCICSPMHFTDKWHWWRYHGARKKLQQLLAMEQPDVVHSNDLPTHQIVSDAARRLQVPRVCHHRFPFSSSAIDWLNKYGAEQHLFVSKALMDEMCTSSTRLSASKRTVVYDGVPLPEQPTEAIRQQARLKLGLASEKVILIFAGQIIERKGVADLLQAWALIDLNVKKQAQLLLVGDDLAGEGKYRVAMQQFGAHLQSDARFVGFQKNLGDWLVASDIAVVPSHVEPLGNATLEAMSYALPVIGCAVGGIPEMLIHEQTGLLVPSHNPRELAVALATLIRDKELRVCYGRQARIRCDQIFSIEAHVQTIVNEYETMVESFGLNSKQNIATRCASEC
jgi:glycosyltransferase involved in cell wall biosynthesis